ncbi:methyltransferase [bacterium]|nr:methyltransferase [bacterium]
MKVTSDACIFGAYLDLENAETVIDIGTGTGLLALMAAQRTQADIHAVEIDESACIQANENIAGSPWQHRISVYRGSIQEYLQQQGGIRNHFDTVICNPPFYSENTKSKHLQKRIAWHDDTLNHTELVAIVADLLQSRGKFHVLLPDTQMDDFNRKSLEVGLFPYSACFLKSYTTSQPHRVIASYCPVKRDLARSEVVIYHSHQVLSETCKRLLSPFIISP